MTELIAGAPSSAWVMASGFAGGLALFLLGMDGVTSGFKGLAGTRLSDVLARLSGNRFAGVGTGMLVTATIQSSTVTMVLVIGFLSSGLLTLTQSVGVIIGANVGTTITAQIIAFDVIGYALAILAVGVLGRFLGRGAVRHAGEALAGLGILFLGMGFMQEAMAPLREYGPFLDLMSAERGPLPGLAIGAAFTALVQSSSATIGIVIVMASSGLIPLETGIALTLGASLGTAVTTMIATVGRPPVALRAGLIHVLFNVVGVTVILLLLDPLAAAAVALSPAAPDLSGQAQLAAETPRQIANAYTLAKAAMVLGFLGFTPQLARLAERLVPVGPAELRGRPRHLDPDVLEAPSVALDLAHREVDRLGRHTVDLLRRTVPTVLTGTRRELTALADGDDDLDQLYDAILDYLRRIDEAELSPELRRRLTTLMTVASSYELVGDVVQHELVRIGTRRLDEGVPVSAQTLGVVGDFHATMCALLADAQEAFAAGDVDRAHAVLDAKPEVNEMLEEVAAYHATRFGADAPKRVAAYTRGTETIEQLRRVYSIAKRVARSVPGVQR